MKKLKLSIWTFLLVSNIAFAYPGREPFKITCNLKDHSGKRISSFSDVSFDDPYNGTRYFKYTLGDKETHYNLYKIGIGGGGDSFAPEFHMEFYNSDDIQDVSVSEKRFDAKFERRSFDHSYLDLETEYKPNDGFPFKEEFFGFNISFSRHKGFRRLQRVLECQFSPRGNH